MNSNKSIYTQIYDNLVEKGRYLKEEWKPVCSGLERHHIIPKHQGGTDDDDNFTYLTHREHIAAHFLLWKINGHVGDQFAYQMMKGVTCHPTHLGRKHTEESRRRMSEAHKGQKLSEEHKRRISEGRKGKKGKPHTEESKQRISDSLKGKKKSEETRRRISKSNKGKKRTKETKQRMSESHKGKKHTEETKQKMTESRKGKKQSEETRRKRSESMKKAWAKRKAQTA